MASIAKRLVFEFVDFAEVFREFLSRKKLSHVEFSELVGVTSAFVSRVATRRDKLPLDRIDGWAKALQLSGDDLRKFTESAHLAKATDEVRGLVNRLRLESAKGRQESIDLRALRAVGIALAPNGDYAKECRSALVESVAGLDRARARRGTLTAERDQLAARIGDLALNCQIGAPGWSEALRSIGSKMEAVDRELAALSGVIAAGEIDLADLDLVLADISAGAARLTDASRDACAAILRDVVYAARIVDGKTVLELYPPRHANAGGSENGRLWYSYPHGLRTIRVHVATLKGSANARIPAPQ